MKLFRLTLCLALSVLMLLSCCGCKKKETQLDYTFQNARFTDDPHAQNTFSFSFTCSIPADIQPGRPVQTVETSIVFPDGFAYLSTEQTMSCSAFSSINSDASVVYAFNGFVENRETGIDVALAVYLHPEKEYIVIHLSDLAGSYLVAASDAEANPAEILAYMGNYLHLAFDPPVTATTQVATVPTEGEMGWLMNAMLVTPDGQVQEQFEITVDDIILNTDSNTMSLALDIRTPETFRYVFEVPDTGYPVISGKTDGLPYYVWMGYSFDRSIGDYSWGSYALCMEQEYLIMNWNDDESLFLVASRDTEIAPSAILAYFQGYLDLYAFDSAPTDG